MTRKSKPARTRSVLEDLPFYLARASLSFRRFNDETLRTVGLRSQAPGMGSVLHVLEENDQCTVSELVEKTHLPNGTLTGLLDRLERDRCIQRVNNDEDGRSWRIRLTPAGMRMCERLHQRHRMVMGMFGELLSAKETALLKELLGRITDPMREFRSSRGARSAVARKRRASASRSRK